MTRAVLSITGMHRSGTSLAASWLEACGLPIHRGRVWGPAEGNDLGHFEDIDFEELHRGAILDRWPDSRGWLAGSATIRFKRRERKRASRLVEARASLEVWGWKDPRSLLFLDEWFGIIPNLRVLAITRPREQVVDSLLRRAAIATNPHMQVTPVEAEEAYDLYASALARASEGHASDVLVVALPDLLENPRRVFDRLQEELGGALRYVPIDDVYRQGKLKA